MEALHQVLCIHSEIYVLILVRMLPLIGDETLTGLAVEAAKGALQMAEVESDGVDLVIMCTSTPDDLFGGGGQVCSILHFSCMILLILMQVNIPRSMYCIVPLFCTDG